MTFEPIIKSKSYYSRGAKRPYMKARLIQNPMFMETIYTCESGRYIRPTVGVDVIDGAWAVVRYKHEKGCRLLKVHPRYIEPRK